MLTFFFSFFCDDGSYYPIFPAPLPSKSINSLNLDITHNDLIRMSKGPDVMILPSILKHFAKVSKPSTALHPSLPIPSISFTHSFTNLFLIYFTRLSIQQ